MRCHWCENPLPFGEWVIFAQREDIYRFCHTGCLVHWLFTQVPEYFDELFDAMKDAE